MCRVLELRTVPAYGETGARAVRVTPHDPETVHPDELRDHLTAILEAHAGKQACGLSLADVVATFVTWA